MKILQRPLQKGGSGGNSIYIPKGCYKKGQKEIVIIVLEEREVPTLTELMQDMRLRFN